MYIYFGIICKLRRVNLDVDQCGNALIRLGCSMRAAFNAVSSLDCHVEEKHCALLAQTAWKRGIFHKLFGVHWAVTIETNHAWYSSSLKKNYCYCFTYTVLKLSH